ncbi:MAG TPA: hypothetical protein VFY73_24765 [Ideonella sp.]|uniref:hypothetical protein n=1 Tax=Ideonella sp. TaxID=1929293 RepID=UPI002E353326|nr:hypothetical protein [Ideonella sp.]HEX5687241.1 hypothetical protein [Ideonella sp.]
MTDRIYTVHHSTPIYQSPVRAPDFGRQRWGQVNTFEQVVARPPMGTGPRFEESTVYRSFRAVFMRGEPWEATVWFKRNLKLIESGEVLWNCRTREEWLNRLENDVRALYESIRTHGFLEQASIAERALSDSSELGRFVREGYPSGVSSDHEIKLGINEDGKLLFLDGRHRLAVAKLLRVERIPVRVVFVHRAFLERHPEWAAADRQPGGATSDVSLVSRLIRDHIESGGKPAREAVRYLTGDEYAAAVESLSPERAKTMTIRWEYHKSAIDFVQLCRPRSASDVLEMGPGGVSIVHGSETIDFAAKKAQLNYVPTWFHDGRETPWPVADKRYQVFVALRVFHQLSPCQRACFLEAKRVARNIVMVVAEPEDLADGDTTVSGLSEAQFTEWNNGVRPTVTVKLPFRVGRLYFWNEESLGA